MQVDFAEFRSAYLAEVDEHLAGVNARLLELDACRREGRPQGRELRELLRLLHTIKGLSSMVNVEAIVDIAHEMESVLRLADQAASRIDEPTMEALIEGVRAIESRVAALSKGETVEPPPAALLAALGSVVLPVASIPPPELTLDPEVLGRLSPSERQQLATAHPPGRRSIRIDFAPSSRKADAGLTITSVRERLARIGDLVKVVPVSARATESTPGGLVFILLMTTEATDEALANAVGGHAAEIQTLTTTATPALPGPLPVTLVTAEDTDAPRTGFLRVEVARVDDTIEKLSALIVTRSRLSRAAAALAAAGADTRELDAVIVDAARQLRDLRGAILSVRMVPLAAVLERLPLVVRGLGRTSGKKVRLVLEAGTAELDKTVAERLFPAFVHLLRNAVDHGIEAPDARTRLGKGDEGTIRITASARGSRYVDVRVEDDGGGIDPARVAVRAKVDVPKTNGALLDILCRPGFSTREQADRTSGRGVGMDIVKRTIESLGGELTLTSEPGRGTAFVVRVPLTIAVVDAFTVTCAGKRFAVPVPAVAEIVEIDEASVSVLPATRDNREVRVFSRRGEVLALVDLAQALGLVAGVEDPGAAPIGTRAKQAFVVRRTQDDPIAFAIDKVLGQQETVVRPLTDPLVSVAGISGSTDLGDGLPTLVLDLLSLSASLGAVNAGIGIGVATAERGVH